MTNITGSYSIDDLRAVRFPITAGEFGLDTINKTLQADLANWNAQKNDALGLFVETTTDRQRIWGSSATVDMVKIDEEGRAPTSHNRVGNTIAFDLNRYASAVGYNDLWFKMHSPAEMAEMQMQVERGNNERTIKEIQRALYTSGSVSFADNLVDKVTLVKKSFVFGDGDLIPDAPNGAKFDGTHTHYTVTSASAAFAAADLTGLVTKVSEHGLPGLIMVIAEGNLAEISALTGFTKLSAPVMQYNASDSTIARLDTESDPSNRFVGYWGDNFIPVYTKPFALLNYVAVMATGAAEKPLVRRIHTNAQLQGLRLEGKLDNYPLYADNYVDIFGISVWNRVAGAVLYKGASYTNPTIG